MILELPAVLACRLVTTWLDVKSICCLDSAYCGHSIRNSFLDLLKCDALVLPKLPTSQVKSLGNFYVWASSRCVKIEQVWINPKCGSAAIMNRYLRCTGHQIVSCGLMGIRSEQLLLYSGIIALHCRNVRSLRIAQCTLDDAVSDLLCACANLVELYIVTCDGVDRNCFVGVSLPQLKALSLKNCQCDDECVEAALRISPNVERIEITWSPYVTEATLRTITRRCPKLTTLGACGTFMEVTEPTNLSALCRHLQRIDLSWSGFVTDDSVAALMNHCRCLRTLWLSDISALTDASVEAIRENPHVKLRSVNLSNCCNLTASALVSLVQSNQPTHSYYFGREVDNAALARDLISNLPISITKLVFKGDVMTDELLVAIASHCPSLQCLKIAKCQGYTIAGLTTLVQSCSSLCYLLMNNASTLFVGPAGEIARSLWQVLNPRLCINFGSDTRPDCLMWTEFPEL